MKITRIDTLRLDEFPSLVYVLVHTDEGLVGLGETFFFAAAVEAHVHTVAPYLLGKDPGAIERMRARCAATSEPRAAARRCAPRRRSTLRCGISAARRPGSRCTSCSAARRRDSIRTYNTCAGYRYIRDESGQAVDELGPARTAEAEGPYEDLDAFLNRADELARDLLAQGITGMKIWPFDPYAEASLGHDITHRRPRSRARAVQEDSCGGRPGD